MEAALAVLTSERRERALRLRHQEARLRSAGAGLLLRHFFGEKSVSRTSRGKPYIDGATPFSLSHSGTLAVLAVSPCPVGVDVETIAPVRDGMPRRVLTEEEQLWLEAHPEDGFFRLWTRKEAALKCLGGGIDRALRSFSVLPGERLTLDGRTLDLYTAPYKGAIISAAAEGESAKFIPRELDVDQLLSKEAR